MKMTDCECTEPGWCARHKCQKSPLSFEYCQRLPSYFAAWERGELRELCRPWSRQDERKTPCQLRGEETRQAPCETCQGSVRIKVFACALHGECVLARAPEGLISCVLCDDYDPLPSPTSSDDRTSK